MLLKEIEQFTTNGRVQTIDSKYNPSPIRHQICFSDRDTRVLSDRSFFQEYDSLRKTHQFDKDFISDQDTVAGPACIPNMIKNILCTRQGSLSNNLDFGIDLTDFFFEQIDWVGVIEIRDRIAQALYTNLPNSVEIEEIDIRSNTNDNEDPQDRKNLVEIDISYSYKNHDPIIEGAQAPGPGPNLDTKKLTFKLGVDGFSGFSKDLFLRSK